MAKNGSMGRREILKLGVAAGAATTAMTSIVHPEPALAAGPAKQVFFNVVNASRIALHAGSEATTFLKVDVPPSQFVGGVHVTLPDAIVPGPEAGGLWRIEQNQTTVIPIPTTGLNYDFTNGGFAAVRALAVDAGGNPGIHDVFGYVALTGPRCMNSVSGSALLGISFKIPVTPGVRNQRMTLCVTPIGNAAVLVRDARTNEALFPATNVNQNHTLVVETAVDPQDPPTQLEAAFSGSAGICSALVSWGPPNRTRRLRVYPVKFV